jgi:hypothetical protein
MLNNIMKILHIIKILLRIYYDDLLGVIFTLLESSIA